MSWADTKNLGIGQAIGTMLEWIDVTQHTLSFNREVQKMSLAQDLRNIQKMEREKENLIKYAIAAVATLLQVKAKANPHDNDATLTLEQLKIPNGYEKIDVLGEVKKFLVVEGFIIHKVVLIPELGLHSEITFGW